MKYSFLKGAWKAIIQTVIFGLPILIQALPDAWMNITIGALLSLLINYLKVKWAEGEPLRG